VTGPEDPAARPRVQARITLPEVARRVLDATRLRWNPEAATGNPAHVTVVYHDEAPDTALLRERLAEATRELDPFELVVGAPHAFPPPVRGAFLAVSDPSAGVARLRERVLRPPFRARERFGLHVTLLHPAQGERLAAAWPELSALAAPGPFPVRAVELISGSGAATETLAAFVLAASLQRTHG
jgi:2'-5' RNA ligase